MGRGRGKGRKSNDSVNHEDCRSGEEEKIPVQKKRGRPLKHLKAAVVRDGVNKMHEEGDGDNACFVSTSKHKSQCIGLNERKMKYESKEKEEQSEIVKEESADETKSSSIEEEPVKPSGFHQNSRRRKNTPRRAAEAVVECC